MKSTLLFLNKLMLLANDHTTFSNSFNPTLLEKCPWVPVESALWYRFLEPVPRKRYQRLEPLVPVKTTGTYG